MTDQELNDLVLRLVTRKGRWQIHHGVSRCVIKEMRDGTVLSASLKDDGVWFMLEKDGHAWHFRVERE